MESLHIARIEEIESLAADQVCAENADYDTGEGSLGKSAHIDSGNSLEAQRPIA